MTQKSNVASPSVSGMGVFYFILVFAFVFLVSLQSQAYLKCYRSKLGALITNPNLISVFCLPFRVSISPIPSLCS